MKIGTLSDPSTVFTKDSTGGKSSRTTRGGRKAKKGLLSPRPDSTPNSNAESGSDAMASDSEGRTNSRKDKQSTN